MHVFLLVNTSMSIIETTFISISQQYIYGTIPFTKTNWCLDYKLNPEKDYPNLLVDLRLDFSLRKYVKIELLLQLINIYNLMIYVIQLFSS